MDINTSDSALDKVSVRRMPSSVRQEVAHQLQDMQKNGYYSAIKVALGKSSHPCEKVRWFQVGHLPIPRIEIYNLLGKFGGTKFFSALDLAAGFWQIWMHQKKMAYTFQALL